MAHVSQVILKVPMPHEMRKKKIKKKKNENWPLQVVAPKVMG